MLNRKMRHEAIIRVVLATCLLLQTLLVPLVEAGNLFEGKSAESLKQQPAESVENYIERIAEVEPELLQNATMTAIQEAFNGHFGEDPAEGALEQRVLFHLNQTIDPMANYQYQSQLNKASELVELHGEGWSASTVRPHDFDESFPPLPEGITIDESAEITYPEITYPETTFSAPPEQISLSQPLVYTSHQAAIPEPDFDAGSRPSVERVPDFVQHAPASLPMYTLDQLNQLELSDGMNGVERVVRIDDIVFTKSFNDVQSQSSSLKITNIRSRLFIRGWRVTRVLSGVLNINMPGNNQKIPIQFQYNSAGQLSGTVSQINLSVAGGRVEMREIKISNEGLSVDSATMKASSKVSKSLKGSAAFTLSDVSITADGLRFKAGQNGISQTVSLFTLIDETMEHELAVWYDDVTDDVIAGETYSYTLAMANYGASAPDYVVITENIPENVTLVESDGCTLEEMQLVCYVGRIEPNAIVTRTITWQAAPDMADSSELFHQAVIETDVALDGVDSSAHNDIAEMRTFRPECN